MQMTTPGELVPIVVPLFGMLTGIVVVGMVAIGPVGRAIGKVLMHLFGADRPPALPDADVGQLRALLEEQADRLDAQQRQLAELAERQDFAERLLAQARSQGRLPSAGNATG